MRKNEKMANQHLAYPIFDVIQEYLYYFSKKRVGVNTVPYRFVCMESISVITYFKICNNFQFTYQSNIVFF